MLRPFNQIASPIVSGTSSTMINETQQRQNEYLKALHQITLDLLENRNRQELLDSITLYAAALLNAPFVEIMFKEGDELVVRTCNSHNDVLLGDRAKRGEATLAWQAYDTQDVVTVDCYANLATRRPLYEDFSVTAVACFPIIINKNCLGVMDLGRTKPNANFTPDQIQEGKLFAQMVAMLLHNANLNETATNEMTHRQQADINLQQSQERQRALMSVIPDLMFRVRSDGSYLDLHTPRLDMLTISPDQFLGLKMGQILPPEIANLHMKHLQNVLATRREDRYEYQLTVGEDITYFECRMVKSGEEEVLAIVRDITEHKKLAQQTFALIVEKERSKLLTQFVQNASHEFRTPLSIIGNAAHLMTITKDVDKLEKYSSTIGTRIDQLSTLLDMILCMTKLDSDIAFNKAEIRLGDLINGLVYSKGKQAKQKNILLDVQVGTQQNIIGDLTWLQEAIRQILDNAVRYTPENGHISVKTYTQDTNVVIEIADTGIGITAEALPHIFERFWREDEAHSTPGFGLGLSIALKIVEMHEGRIEVESEPEKGSIFKVMLPVR